MRLWHTEATRIGALMLALIVFVLGVTLFLAREISRRADAEEKLEELATTDALTGSDETAASSMPRSTPSGGGPRARRPRSRC